MSKARKTIAVETLKADINRQLARTDNTVEARTALASFLEHVLFTTNKYHGFNYVEWSKEGGFDAWRAAGEPNFPEKAKYLGDESRRFYY